MRGSSSVQSPRICQRSKPISVRQRRSALLVPKRTSSGISCRGELPNENATASESSQKQCRSRYTAGPISDNICQRSKPISMHSDVRHCLSQSGQAVASLFVANCQTKMPLLRSPRRSSADHGTRQDRFPTTIVSGQNRFPCDRDVRHCLSQSGQAVASFFVVAEGTTTRRSARWRSGDFFRQNGTRRGLSPLPGVPGRGDKTLPPVTFVSTGQLYVHRSTLWFLVLMKFSI